MRTTIRPKRAMGRHVAPEPRPVNTLAWDARTIHQMAMPCATKETGDQPRRHDVEYSTGSDELQKPPHRRARCGPSQGEAGIHGCCIHARAASDPGGGRASPDSDAPNGRQADSLEQTAPADIHKPRKVD